MAEDNTQLQNLLIQKLLGEQNAAISTEPSTFGTMGVLLLVGVIIIVGIIVVYIIISQANAVKPYPLSNFKYGQTVVIRPAVLSNIPGNINNQYLRQDITPPYNNGSGGCASSGYSMGPNGNAVKFTGNKNDPASQWVLMQYSNPGGYDANQSLQAGLGNRFYLQNSVDKQQKDIAYRLRYQLLNEAGGFGMCKNSTPAVIGADSMTCNWFETDLLIYFMPTNYKDLYYLLVPLCSNAPYSSVNNDTSAQPNDGIISCRPWAQNNSSNQKSSFIAGCYPCTDSGTYDPRYNGILTSNTMMINSLSSTNLNPPYLDPNVHLFKVTLA